MADAAEASIVKKKKKNKYRYKWRTHFSMPLHLHFQAALTRHAQCSNSFMGTPYVENFVKALMRDASRDGAEARRQKRPPPARLRQNGPDSPSSGAGKDYENLPMTLREETLLGACQTGYMDAHRGSRRRSFIRSQPRQ